MKHHLPELLMIASDQFSAFGAKTINVIGAVSLGAGATIVAVGDTAIKAAAPETWLTPEHVMAASIFGSVCFGIKHLYDFIASCYANYKAWRKRKSSKPATK
jgi:hypothetical protein